MNNCAICNQPMKQIPAGVSKSTGKPYSAFWACQDRSHKQPRAGGNPLPNNEVMEVIAEQLTMLVNKVDVMNANLKVLMDEISPKE